MSSSFWLSVRRAWPLGIALLLALLVRSLLWGNLPRQGMVSDEAEYLASAVWLAQGRGFSWHGGWLWTRAPLYPLFLAVHLRLFGITLTPIYLSQTMLGLFQVALVYVLAHYACPLSEATTRWRRFVPAGAASLVGLYFPLAVYNQVLLSETLYITILLAAFVVLAYWQAIGGEWMSWRGRGLLLLAGILLGLATLTRGLAIGFVLVAAGWIWLGATYGAWKDVRQLWRTLVGSCILILGAVLILLPWTVYASRQYGGLVVVDTTGAFNLLLGARTAYDGDRKDAPTRNFVQALLDPRMRQEERELYLQQSCLWQRNDPRMSAALNQSVTDITQANRQQLMSAEGTCLLRERPLAFVGKSLAEFIDFFRINYGGDERFTDGFTTGRLAPAYVLATFLLDDTLYLLAIPLAVIGWTLARQNGTRVPCRASRVSTLIAFWWLYNLLAAPLLFAINRFRVPLMPFLLLYASYGVLALFTNEKRALGRRHMPHVLLACVLLFVVAAPAGWISAYNPLTQSYVAQESYFGPHPSSVVDTWLALRSRSSYHQTVQLQDALGAGDAERAQQVIAAGGLPQPTALLGEALVAGLQNDPEAGLEKLPATRVLADPDRGWQAQAGVVRGDLLRRMGDLGAARAAFTPRVVDDYNPVEWAWNWLHPSPAPDGRIDFGGNLDLGYILGFYLGEGDGKDTWRWSAGESFLRFPAAGTGAPQILRLRIDGTSVDLPDPRFSVWIDGAQVATQPLSRDVRVYDVPLPASASGADVVVTLRAPVFVPPAADLLAQQGPQVGQLRLLGLRLDWAELR